MDEDIKEVEDLFAQYELGDIGFAEFKEKVMEKVSSVAYDRDTAIEELAGEDL